MLGYNRLALRLSGFEEFYNSKESAHLIFKHLENRLDRSYTFPFRTFGLFKLN